MVPYRPDITLGGDDDGEPWSDELAVFANPRPADAPCQREPACVEGGDTCVTFDLTVARPASQGFFDVAVSFEDLFCSAKVDCVADRGGDEPLELLFAPGGSERLPSAVLAFACTAGVGADTQLYLSGLAIDCGVSLLPLGVTGLGGSHHAVACTANSRDLLPTRVVTKPAWPSATPRFAGPLRPRCGAEELMTLPVRRLPGRFYLITRRCERREFRLRPDEDMKAAITVVMADACERYGVILVALVVMGNHYHAVVYDPDGLVSEWMRDVHGQLARFGNLVHERRSHFWDAQEGNAIELKGLKTVADAVGYVMANPVAAGLVASPSAWPGLKTRVEDIGTERGPRFERPEHFFRADGPVSEWARLTCNVPPEVDVERFRRLAAAATKRAVEVARKRMSDAGRSFMGAPAVMAQGPFDSPATKEPNPGGIRGTYRRRVAGPTDEATGAMVERMQVFRSEYARARERMQCGARALVFPAGTHRLWLYFGVQREPPPVVPAAA